MKDGYKRGGLEKGRYHITKGDGTPIDDEAEYFVLRVDTDPHARVALAAYAQSLIIDNEEFSTDIKVWLSSLNLRVLINRGVR